MVAVKGYAFQAPDLMRRHIQFHVERAGNEQVPVRVFEKKLPHWTGDHREVRIVAACPRQVSQRALIGRSERQASPGKRQAVGKHAHLGAGKAALELGGEGIGGSADEIEASQRPAVGRE